MAKMLGIDLGSAAIKLTLFEGSMRRVQFKGAWVRPVPQDVESPPTLEARMGTLRALLADLFPEGPPPVLVMAFPAEETSVRLVTLPFGDRAQVERALPFEVEGQVPFDLEDMVLAWRVLNLTPGQSRVLAVLADKLKVGEWLEGLEALDLNPRHLVVDADVMGAYASRGVQVVVDLGHTRSLVTLCKDGVVVGARALAGGGRDLTLALAKALDLSWEVATERKHRLSLSVEAPRSTPSAEAEWQDEDDTNPVRVDGQGPRQLGPSIRPADEDAVGAAALRAALEPLLTELRATLIAFEDSYDLSIDEVVLAGGTAELGGLVELLRAELGVVVRLLPEPEERELSRSSGALSLVLANRAAGATSSHDVDLRVGEFAFKGDITAYSSTILYGAVGLLAFLIAGVGLFAYQSYQNAAARERVEAQIAQLVIESWPGVADPARVRDPKTALAIAAEQTEAERAQLAALEGVISDAPPTLNILRELSNGVPLPANAKVDVTELSILPEAISMKVDTDGFESATKIENSLKSRPLFVNATGGDSKKVGDIVRFTVTIPLQADQADDSEG